MPPVERVQREINAVKCLGNKLFGANVYDVVARTGLIGVYGYHNGKPLLIIIRTTGDFHPVKTLGEFKRIYQFIAQDTSIVLMRTDRATAASSIGALMQHGYKITPLVIAEAEFKALSECREDAVSKIINQILNAMRQTS